MKRIGFFVCIVLLQFVLFLTITSAVSCANSNQRILRISSSSNAHGEVYDGTGNYAEEVCFNNYFQGNGDGVRTCGTNKVLRLSAQTNAHGEISTQTTVGYIDVCYGDLTCQTISSGSCNNTLGNSYSVIASLSSQTNGHIALGNLYTNQICCRSVSAQPICNYNGICESARSETEANCPSDCRSLCGDGAVTGSEVCDVGPPQNLNGKTCVMIDSSSFYGGTLACASTCLAFDVTECSSHECGDGLVTGSEVCDGTNLTGQTCPSGGSLSCIMSGENSCTLNFSLCTGPVCGNNIKDADEECDGNNELGDWGNVEDCSDLNGYSGGNLSCVMSGTDSCNFNVSECVPTEGFCEENAPFDYTINGTAYVPNTCDEYNRVYPSNETARHSLCINNCVPSASDPVNNGVYGGVASSGCSWDSNQKKCFFNYTTALGQSCRIDYLSEGTCDPNSPFRSVIINSTNIGGTSGNCDAGCGTSQCETTIPCPKIIELPFFGFISALLSVILIACVYFIWKRKK
jgi:hypothetical protein